MIFQRFLKTKAPTPPTIETEPIIAFRSWRVVESPEGVVILYSAVQDYCWPPYESAHGDSENAAGLFAFKKITDALSYMDGTSILGEVSLWGTVVEHRDGYRAEFGYPKKLFVDSKFDAGMIVRLEESYGVPVEVKEDWPKSSPFESSHLSVGLLEIVSDVLYDHEPLRSRVSPLFVIPLGQMTYDSEGHAIAKDWTLTNILLAAQLPSPNRFLIRGIRVAVLEKGSPVPWDDPIYWSSTFTLDICAKNYVRCLLAHVADPGILLQKTDWSKIPYHERHALLSRAEYRLDATGAEFDKFTMDRLEGVLIDQQQVFLAKVETAQAWPGRSILCALTGLSLRAVL